MMTKGKLGFMYMDEKELITTTTAKGSAKISKPHKNFFSLAANSVLIFKSDIV